ncbi:hypothetical protein GCM10008957_23040 [Deinococcus ruber]|uniref:Uncharacterized protein n=1 Tax=Deinococcus ruber TaxID=1848197 RepID=A0A918C7K7_9DEIO|nr:hypothetical protein GCM10008957_23040 [Deinococcus ruber]
MLVQKNLGSLIIGTPLKKHTGGRVEAISERQQSRRIRPLHFSITVFLYQVDDPLQPVALFKKHAERQYSGLELFVQQLLTTATGLHDLSCNGIWQRWKVLERHALLRREEHHRSLKYPTSIDRLTFEQGREHLDDLPCWGLGPRRSGGCVRPDRTGEQGGEVKFRGEGSAQGFLDQRLKFVPTQECLHRILGEFLKPLFCQRGLNPQMHTQDFPECAQVDLLMFELLSEVNIPSPVCRT